jgi:hypothetical protein
MIATAEATTEIAAPVAHAWPRCPALYEINTWVWLAELSRKYARAIDLGSVPGAEWDAIARFAFDAVWFMGVWERSPSGLAVSNQHQGLLADFRRALPDYRTEDNVGSPYCVRRYEVDAHLGGRDGLAVARRQLSDRGLNLILDFVPTHVAHDHPWVGAHPEYFVRGSADDLRRDPSSFVEVAHGVSACGRDPYFPAWPDVLQLNAFDPGLRTAVKATVSDIAAQCDGIRCDMAMLLVNHIFERTWGSRAGQRPQTDYWSEVIPAIKKQHPEFLFIAEAYWGMEWELQQQGFDFCYDKTLYDRLEHGDAESIRLHLCADLSYQQKLLRFIENHDEPRAACTFSPAMECAAALTSATLPGCRLFHEGQFEGRKVRLPVFLARRLQEPVDRELQEFYSRLLKAIRAPALRDGEWKLCSRTGWPDNGSFVSLVAWTWQRNDDRLLIVVNLSGSRAQARVQVPDIASGQWRLSDLLSDVTFERDGDEMRAPGLYVDLGPWEYHFVRCFHAR